MAGRDVLDAARRDWFEFSLPDFAHRSFYIGGLFLALIYHYHFAVSLG
jgi:hypothetical protein